MKPKSKKISDKQFKGLLPYLPAMPIRKADGTWTTIEEMIEIAKKVKEHCENR
jgi:hypothetical protein